MPNLSATRLYIQNRKKKIPSLRQQPGLHFTDKLLEEIRAKGVEEAFVTLQVGLGTFRPVKTENLSEHIMHSEICEITDHTAPKNSRNKKKRGPCDRGRNDCSQDS